ncbi:uncharacterized protein LOC120079141 [Benincasa hispida]|uniref:uncharacterized protein LOC120079141 n=1 Tax=Benincasa hispida TaxID=102211 RepID=UPI0019007113|nr:uncharacterized protein LOC120079141 [Benincasa hispida]
MLRENVSAITLRSGKELKPPVELVKEPELDPEILSSDQTVFPPQNKQGVSSHPYPSLDAYVPKAPSPSKLTRPKEAIAYKDKELLEMFRSIEINIPLLNAIKEILKYAKFCKELCTRKRQAKEKERMVVSQSVSTILQKNLPKKRRIQHLTENGIVIQLVDRSFIHPLEVIKDVLVQVNELRFPADFYVLKMEESISISSTSIFLGCPFMKTAKTKIDVDEGTLSVEFDGELVKFNIFDAMKTSSIGQEVIWDVYDDNEDDSKDLIPLGELATLSMIEQAPKFELKELPDHLKYAYLGEAETLLKYKLAIGWTLADIKSISPAICLHWISLEDGAKPRRQPQRQLNSFLNEVVMNKVFKLLDACIIYPIPDSDWMLERLARNPFFRFLDGFLSFYQIPINQKDQQNTTFTCPYGTFSFRIMSFGLCNALGTFQHCMMSIFSEYIEKCKEVFMDDFIVYGDSFADCLSNLSKVLEKCIESNLARNFEKCHFMASRGIVLGHIISEHGIEVDPTKIDVITKLPYPTNVREVHSFLGHVGFYRRFIKDFSKVAQLMTSFLQKNIAFDFNDEYRKSFEVLKNALSCTPVIQAPRWANPFEIMCDTSYHAVGAADGISMTPCYADIVNYMTTVDYVSKWVDKKATVTDDVKVVACFLKTNIHSKFGFPKAIITD